MKFYKKDRIHGREQAAHESGAEVFADDVHCTLQRGRTNSPTEQAPFSDLYIIAEG